MADKSPPMREQLTLPMEQFEMVLYVMDKFRDIYGETFPRDQIERMYDIAIEQGLLNQACKGGYFGISPVGGPGKRGRFVTISDNSGPARKKSPSGTAGTLPSTRPVHYTSTKRTDTHPKKETAMAARGRAAAQAEEPVAEEAVEENGEKDYTAYATKEPTAAMVDFRDWIVEIGAAPEFATQKEEVAFMHGVRLGGTLRAEFQRSDKNIANREARRAARATAAAEEPEVAVEEAAPKPAAPKRGRPAAAAAKPTTPKRGRPKVAATAEPF